MACKLSPRAEAAAFIIWADCRTHGWDRQVTEIAATTGMSAQRVIRIVQLKGWQNRLRCGVEDTRTISSMISRIDDALEGIGGAHPWGAVA